MDKLQALGREIRYVEYKLRRQQQEKKKKKQMQRDFENHTGMGGGGGASSGGYNDISNNNGGAVQAREFTFDQESDFAKSVANSVGGVSTNQTTPKSELEKARPSTQQEEQLQLELALAMSRDAAEKPQSPTSTAAPPVGTFVDIGGSAQPVSSPPQPTFDPWGDTGATKISAPPQKVQPSWDPFESSAAPPASVVPPAPSADPFGASVNPWGAQSAAPAAPQPPQPAAASQAGWTAFDDSFSAAPAQIAQPEPPKDNLFDLPAAAPPVAPDNLFIPTVQENDNHDLFGGSMAMSEAQLAEAQKARKTPTDFLGCGANLVNFDNLVSRPKSVATTNPFMSTVAGKKNNPFHKQGPVYSNLTESPYRSEGVSMNQMVTQTHSSGFDGLSGGGMAPMQPMNSAPMNQPVQPASQVSQPVFTSQPQNLMFGVQPLSLPNQNNKNNNPFNF